MAYKTLDLESACEALKTGGIIAFPTETFYGLGCDALNPDAVGAVYAMKQRPYGLPLPVIIGDIADLGRVAVDIHPLARQLMSAYWPGPLSIIFTASPEVPDLLTAGTGRIAVRFSPHPGCIALCRASRCVVTASSANISGTPPASTPADLDPALGSRLAGVYVSPPPPHGGKPSTIVDILASGSESAVRILRDGAISSEYIRSAGFDVVGADGQ
ncbi:YrdC domain protein [uncultured delta proteobacterium]|uniref:L-threonylcarbamoyladenylate synthase n=1 Tax=uncultured delta proteobacterium TaxID=34034 RepID=A0A212IU08_9DELT|nr:YrdC domain protein [uncultured delta proteobacterium]